MELVYYGIKTKLDNLLNVRVRGDYYEDEGPITEYFFDIHGDMPWLIFDRDMAVKALTENPVWRSDVYHPAWDYISNRAFRDNCKVVPVILKFDSIIY